MLFPLLAQYIHHQTVIQLILVVKYGPGKI